MSARWIEIKQASKEYDIELDYLCEQVIDGKIKTVAEKDQLMVDSEILTEFFKTNKSKNNNLVNDELSSTKMECAWLKSENLKNEQVIKHYSDKFTELKALQEELIDIVSHQSSTIRRLNGYDDRKSNKINLERNHFKPRINLLETMWVLFPIMGLFLTAAWEASRAYNINNLNDLLTLAGL